MRKQTTKQLHTIYRQLKAILTNQGYTETDIQTVLRDYVVAEALGKPYLGLEKALAIMLTQTGHKHQQLHTEQHGTYLRVDARGEFLALVMQEYLPTAVDIARTTGSCIFLVHGAKTSPLPALYSYLATCGGMVVMQTSYLPIRAVPLQPNTPAIMGTNPFSLAVPLGNRNAFVFDSAVSEKAAAKLQPGETLLPFGGMKGFNLGVFGLLMAGVANHEQSNILDRNDYAAHREASFCYILLSNPALVNPATQQQYQDVLAAIAALTNGTYATPGRQYKQALAVAERALALLSRSAKNGFGA